MDNSYLKAYCKIEEYNRNHINSCCCSFTDPIVTVAGSLTNTLTETLSAVGQIVTFNNSNLVSGVSANDNSITVNTSGNYLINYGYTASSGTGSAISIYVNGVELERSRLTLKGTAGSVSGSVVVSLNKGDTLTLRCSLYTADLVLPADTLNAYLTLKSI